MKFPEALIHGTHTHHDTFEHGSQSGLQPTMTILRVLEAAPTRHRLWRLTRFAKTLAVATACSSSSSSVVAASSGNSAVQNFTLSKKWQTSPDGHILRFTLPPELPKLDLAAPSGVKLMLPSSDDEGVIIEKSYSPISHEDTEGYFDLLVKSYPPQPGGGFGLFLCDLIPGQSAPLKIKKSREIQGRTGVGRRWSSLTMIGGGTGVAPFVQIIRSILADEQDLTELRLIFVNRQKEDILMKKELDKLARDHDQLTITYILTEEQGRGSVELSRQLIPSPFSEEINCSSSTNEPTCAAYEPSEPKREGRSRAMVLVCGKDGFVGTWAGPLVRIPASPGVKKQKLQGPVGGFLKKLGYDEHQVYKF
jgi:cytochrome-b5 reductase